MYVWAVVVQDTGTIEFRSILRTRKMPIDRVQSIRLVGFGAPQTAFFKIGRGKRLQMHRPP